MLANGVHWPKMEVATRQYRFRVLNGSNARLFQLALSNAGHSANGKTHHLHRGREDARPLVNAIRGMRMSQIRRDQLVCPACT